MTGLLRCLLSCTVDACDLPIHGHGLCKRHYQRKQNGVALDRPWRQTGRPFDVRFWEKVDRSAGPNACWIWLASHDRKGYAQFGTPDARSTLRAHRIAYEFMVGPIPEGLQLDHLCRNHGCVNPAHLEPVTNRENRLRGTALITHCPQGHPYSTENTYRNPAGHRYCITCRRETYRRYRSRSRAA